jgi:hypothetical protein
MLAQPAYTHYALRVDMLTYTRFTTGAIPTMVSPFSRSYSSPGILSNLTTLSVQPRPLKFSPNLARLAYLQPTNSSTLVRLLEIRLPRYDSSPPKSPHSTKRNTHTQLLVCVLHPSVFPVHHQLVLSASLVFFPQSNTVLDPRFFSQLSSLNHIPSAQPPGLLR